MIFSACSTTQPVPIDLPDVDPTPPVALPAPIETRDVTFGVITENDVAEGLIPPAGTVTLTPDEFEDLSYNLGDAARWVREAMEQLRYYRGDTPSDDREDRG